MIYRLTKEYLRGIYPLLTKQDCKGVAKLLGVSKSGNDSLIVNHYRSQLLKQMASLKHQVARLPVGDPEVYVLPIGSLFIKFYPFFESLLVTYYNVFSFLSLSVHRLYIKYI